MAILNRESTSYVSKRYLGPIVAPSDYKELIGATDSIGFADTSVIYPSVVDISTPTSIANSWEPEVQEQGYAIGQVFLPTYTVKAKYRYNILEEANLDKNIPGLGMQQLQDSLIDLALGMRLRQLVLHGNAAGEGLVNNTQTANTSNKWTAIDPGVLLQEILHHVDTVMQGIYSRGKSIKICMPTKLKTYLNTALVNATNYLTSGSTHSIGGALQRVLEEAFKKEVSIIEDNTLVGPGEKVQMLIVVPTLEDSRTQEQYDVSFSMGDTTATYLGISNLIKSQNPQVDGYMSGYCAYTATAGANLRKEASLLLTGDFK